LTGDELAVKVVVRYGKARAYAALRYVPELGYPLMYVEKVEEET
ncbi:MAG: dihydroneopterin aldolase, partial [Thermoprotei archaeon]